MILPIIIWMFAALALVAVGPSAELGNRLLISMASLAVVILLGQCFILLGGRDARERRRVVVKMLVAGCGVFAAILIVEFLGRVFVMEPLYPWDLNPPHVSVDWKTAEFDTRVTTNPQGLREPRFVEREHPDTFRIVVIGDSITFGQGVNDHETYPRRLEVKLRERFGMDNLRSRQCFTPGGRTRGISGIPRPGDCQSQT